MNKQIEKDYWKYYVRLPYNSPVYKNVVDEDGNTKTEYKCCYPVRLLDWDEYSDIAYPILTISPTLLERRLHADLNKISLFEYVVVSLLQQNKVQDMEKMFSMAFDEEVVAMLYTIKGEQEVRFVFSSDNDFYIDKNNYPMVREILMAQSFFFDPIVGKDEKSQKLINKAIQRKAASNKTNTNLESMIALVRSEGMVKDWSTYTYYELRIDYCTILKKEEFRSVHVYKVMGSNAKIPEFSELLDVHNNPLGEDVLFKKNDRTKDSY